MSEQVLKKSWLVCISNRPLPADCILIVKCLESFFISPKIEFGCLDEQIVKDFEYTLFLRLTIIFLEINHHHYYFLSRIYTSTLLLLFSWTNWRIIVISISITMTIHSRIFLIYKYYIIYVNSQHLYSSRSFSLLAFLVERADKISSHFCRSLTLIVREGGHFCQHFHQNYTFSSRLCISLYH